MLARRRYRRRRAERPRILRATERKTSPAHYSCDASQGDQPNGRPYKPKVCDGHNLPSANKQRHDPRPARA
eukprot:7086716-Alexandrium_andersonii.AAC.1